MFALLIKWLILSGTVYLLPELIPDIVVDDFWVAIITAAVIAIVNMVIKPVVQLLTLPVNFLTLGLFGVIVNALLFWGVSSLIPGFVVHTFLAALLGSVVMSLARWVVVEIF